MTERWPPILEDADPGDEAAPRELEFCPGPITPCDQTVMCELCGLAWWGEDNDRFEVVHGPEWTWNDLDEDT